MTSLASFYSQQLTRDLEWREAELAVMRKQLYQTSAGSLSETVMLRASTAMIYAHYEGFCKFGLESYIDALEKLKLKRKDVVWPLAALSLGTLRRDVSQLDDLRQFYERLVNGFNSAMEGEAKYERPPQIANLWPDLLSKWLVKLNLSRSAVDGQSAVLELLVDNRNKIAHGKKLTVASRTDLDKYWHAATLAMHEVAVGIVDALEAKAYRRSGAASTALAHAI